MSKKIVCISYINDTVDFIEIERSKSGNLVLSPSYAKTSESLQAACKRADEIHVSGLFSSCQYDWEIFPKVEERYLESIVSSFFQRKRPSVKVSARFQHICDVVKGGNPNASVALQSVEQAEIDSVLSQLDKFRQKIKFIYSLPAVLAGALVQAEKPDDNVILFWAGEEVSVITIVSPEGLVKIARTLPYGLPGSNGPEVETKGTAGFSEEIAGEVTMTVNYFKQKFREPAPEKIYLLGTDRLADNFESATFTSLGFDLHGTISGDLPGLKDSGKISESAHLLGTLFANESFNFLPVQETSERKVNSLLSATIAVLVVLLLLTGLWTLRIPEPQSRPELTNKVRELQFDIRELQEAVAVLKPIEGRKKYYHSAFLDEKPDFVEILQQISSVVPPEMIFDSFRMAPAEGFWNCMITGQVKGKDWQERLDTLRRFGSSLYTFPNISIENVTHSLEQAGVDATMISFQLSLQLITGDETE